MSEALLTAILTAVARFGFAAVATFLEKRGDTADTAVAALREAEKVSLEEIIAKDAAARGMQNISESFSSKPAHDPTKPDV